MSVIGRAHDMLARDAAQIKLQILASEDLQVLIRGALSAHDKLPRRTSPLHPSLVVWLVLGMALFRALSIPNVFAQLMAAWRHRRRELPIRPVTDGALAHARERLGAEPLRAIFEQVAAQARPDPSFFHRRVYAMDASVFCVPDTPANDRGFGRHCTGVGRRTAFPQLRLISLMAVRTHQIRGALWAPMGTSEKRAADPLYAQMGPGDLLLLDRGLGYVAVASRLLKQGADFLYPLCPNCRPKVLAKHAPGDYDVELASRYNPDGVLLRLRVRMIVYRVGKGGEVRCLVTSITDRRISPLAIIALYHERWENELSFDELKTHLSAAVEGTPDTHFRGRSPQSVEQEIWATLTLYNLARGLMAKAAALHQVDARRLSFVDSVELVRIAVHEAAGVPTRARLRLYRRLMADFAGCIMRRWRRPRLSPRAIKAKSMEYRPKRPHERTIPRDFLASVRLATP